MQHHVAVDWPTTTSDVLLELETGTAGLTLRELTVPDALDLHCLLQRNRDHLTRHGNYVDACRADLAEVISELAERTFPPLRFGIREHGVLVGRVDLELREPPQYGLGYWLDESATGRGIGAAAVAAVLIHARDRVGATDVFAGVTHGNDRSVRLVERLGFEAVNRFAEYTRFQRRL